MGKYKLEAATVLIQFAVFYLLPLAAVKMGAVMMVILMLAATGAAGAFLGCWSDNGIKYLLPVAAAVMFMPTVPMYYNPSAMVQTLWYFVVSAAGMCFGTLINKIRE